MDRMRKVTTVIRAADVEGKDNRSKFIAATNQLARDGHILEPRGMSTENFLRSGTILFNHRSDTPVATPVSAAINSDGELEIEVEWPPAGVSEDADKVRGLVKAGVLRAGSVGFDPIDMTPLDPKRPYGGQHITRSELLEFSVVCVPADTGAVVTQRNQETSTMTSIEKLQRALDSLKQLGEHLEALSPEETHSLLEGAEGGGIGGGPRAALDGWQRDVVLIRAARALSASNKAQLEDAQNHLDRGKKNRSALLEHHNAVTGHADEIRSAHADAVDAHAKLGEALAAAKGEPEKAVEHVARALKSHKAVSSAHEDIAEAHSNLMDRHQDAGDASEAVARCLNGAQRCVRSVVEGATPGAEDGDVHKVQSSKGTEDAEGSKTGRNSPEYQRRQAELKTLTPAA